MASLGYQGRIIRAYRHAWGDETARRFIDQHRRSINNIQVLKGTGASV